MFASLFKPFKSYKYLLLQLTQREVKARYKQSFVGYAWVLLNPIAQMFIYTFVFSMVFHFPTNEVPYPIFLFVALLPWNTLTNTLSHSTMSLVENASLLKKVFFPREVIPYSVVFSKMIDFFFSLFSLLVLAFLYKVSFAATAIFFIPLFLIQSILTTGASFILSAFNLFYRDVQYLTNLLLMIWMYLTPIVYPVSMVPQRFLFLYKLNPMVGLVEGYRAALFGYDFEISLIFRSLVISILIFVIGFLIFKKSEKYFADAV